ncbi:hypothetical protein ACQP2F_21260 [Actinoplanes sp. CA-030573]|uniref:hypothetical protein n=1 Tax=Actinoplanes sp. CA-030573 TaxID=3239898 RepID=UPI003D933FDD
MSGTLHQLTATILGLLPELTTVARFLTALTALGLAADRAARRSRRRRRDRTGR